MRRQTGRRMHGSEVGLVMGPLSDEDLPGRRSLRHLPRRRAHHERFYEWWVAPVRPRRGTPDSCTAMNFAHGDQKPRVLARGCQLPRQSNTDAVSNSPQGLQEFQPGPELQEEQASGKGRVRLLEPIEGHEREEAKNECCERRVRQPLSATAGIRRLVFLRSMHVHAGLPLGASP